VINIPDARRKFGANIEFCRFSWAYHSILK
jgi:hypothetical protein